MVRVLVTVPIKSLPAPTDVRVPDGGCLISHLWMLHGMLALRGTSCTQKQLMLSVRCVARMILHTTPRLTKVRACRGAGLPHCHQLCW